MIRDPEWTGVLGWLYPPAGRRRTWLLLVPRCPSCGGYSHAHRVDRFGSTFVRSPSCRPSSTYEVTVYVVLPTGAAA